MATIGLVACSKQKLDRLAPARALYTSPLFRHASAYCERTYDRWYILSALHGLVEPDRVIEPYDVTLMRMTPADRFAWGDRVNRSPIGSAIRAALGEGAELYLHAGAVYCVPFPHHPRIFEPLAGLMIGQRLRWYKEHRP